MTNSQGVGITADENPQSQPKQRGSLTTVSNIPLPTKDATLLDNGTIKRKRDTADEQQQKVLDELQKEELGSTNSDLWVEGAPSDEEKGSAPTRAAGNLDDVTDQQTRLPFGMLMVVYVGLMFGYFLASVDGTIIATALPKIASTYNQLNEAPWVRFDKSTELSSPGLQNSNTTQLTIAERFAGRDIIHDSKVTTSILQFQFHISANACQVIFGKMSDIFGRRSTIVFALTTFLVGCLICATANDFITMIAGRILSGIGGGGVLTDKLDWRWIFWINLPFGCLSLVLLASLLRLPKVKGSIRHKLHRIDYAGIAFMAGAPTFLLLAINFGGNDYAWDSPIVVSCFWAAGVSLGIFLAIEAFWAKEPVIPLRLFKNRWIVSITIGNFFCTWTMVAFIIYLPLFYQVVHGDTPTISGTKMIPMMVGLIIFAISSGIFVSRKGYANRSIVLGTVVLTIGSALVSTFDQYSGAVKEYCYTIIVGAGIGMFMAPSITAVQGAVDQKDVAITTSLVSFFRLLGSACGIAVFGCVLQNQLAAKLIGVLPAALFESAKTSVDGLDRLPLDLRASVIQAYVESIQLNLQILIGISALGFLAVTTLIGWERNTGKKTVQPMQSE
ncbi:major facilitator superfamily domain-containing protein [Jimgerdemannia flammicorona]|uniref:Major facilitator superfamily domain-containing protein n=1 Tax=Jimgerdemannia flammicorona TaxID=994334 RepID=A0A433QVJ6_9FUNG|nr:major facilitator superfamily domain-containing protein [Jimgerdemannia flammicorona]